MLHLSGTPSKKKKSIKNINQNSRNLFNTLYNITNDRKLKNIYLNTIQTNKKLPK